MEKTPASCTSMEELRALIDALDADIVARLAFRAACIDRAVELKQDVGWPARIDTRVEEVVGKVRGEAVTNGLDPDLIERIWRELIEWSIAREEATLGNGGPPKR